jgi:16S rRNA (uracil1498-N3)-methyltransferase
VAENFASDILYLQFMRLHRFFARNLSESKQEPQFGGHSGTNSKEIVEGSIITYAHDTHQWQRVFRYGQGDRVILFDGSGNDYVCEILAFPGEINGVTTGATLRVVEVRVNTVQPARQVILVVALVKKDTFEWIVEKATELGVAEIVPVLAERSEKKNLNTERLEKILIEAAEQSGRGDVPVLHEMMDLAEVLKDTRIVSNSSAIVFDPSGRKFTEDDFTIGKGGEGKHKDDTVAVFIGPEGGWSSEELELFKKVGLPILSLGPQVLRTETAVVAVLSRLVF